MKVFNRILVVLIVLLTIGSGILAVLLYQNRNLMRDRADAMAEALVNIVSYLDRESQTDAADDVTFTPRDVDAGTPDSGSLSWQRYLEDQPDFNTLDSAVERAESLADDVNEQRNHLAEKLAEAAEILGHDNNLARHLSNAADPDLYQNRAQIIIRLAEAVRDRTNDMVDTYMELAEIAGVNVNRDDFFQRQEERDPDGDLIETDFQHESIIADIRDEIEAMRDARNAYREALVTMVNEIPEHDWSVSASEIEDRRRYERALTSLENDFDEINAELIRSAQRQDAIAELDDELEETEGRLVEVVSERDRLADELEELEHRLQKLDPDRPITEIDPEVDVQEYFPRDATGEVIEVNERFGFVVINLGFLDKANTGLNLLVERDGQFVARIEITEAAKNFSIADVIPGLMISEIQPGDRVISP